MNHNKPLDHFAWCYEDDGKVLHCVPDMVDDAGFWHEEMIEAGGGKHATSLCKTQTTYLPPGIFSRISLERCRSCCEALGISYGVGTPKNEAFVKTDHLKS